MFVKESSTSSSKIQQLQLKRSTDESQTSIFHFRNKPQNSRSGNRRTTLFGDTSGGTIVDEALVMQTATVSACMGFLFKPPRDSRNIS